MRVRSRFRRPASRAALVVAAVGVLAALLPGAAGAGGYTDASYLTPRGTVGQPYSHRVEWKPGNGCPPYSYAVVGGDFPPGLSLSSDGYISGTPSKEGRWVFYIRQTDLCGPEGEGNSPFVINVDGSGPPPPPPHHPRRRSSSPAARSRKERRRSRTPPRSPHRAAPAPGRGRSAAASCRRA